MKTHLAVQTKAVFGGTMTTTLCGRMSSKSEDGMNSGEREEVTCEHCKSILTNPKNWRYRKYLAA